MTDARWKDKLRPARFRNAFFFVDSSKYSGGRRVVKFEFPGRDLPATEDLGRKIRSFSVEAHCIGSDYMTLRDRLLDACEKAGPGKLIHPYYGTKSVQLEDFSVQETTQDGGMARISMVFVEAGTLAFPKISNAAFDLLDRAIDFLNTAEETDFAGIFSAVGLADDHLSSAVDKVHQFANAIDKAASGFSGVAISMADLAFGIRNLRGSVSDLIHKPEELVTQILGSLDLLRGAILEPGARPGFETVSAFMAFGKYERVQVNPRAEVMGFSEPDPVIPLTTESRKREAANREAINKAIRIGAIANASQLAVSLITPGTAAMTPSYEDAKAIQDILTSVIDAEMEDPATSDSVYIALQDLRKSVVLAIPSEEQDLPHLTEVTLKAATPSLVLAYDLYGSLDLERDLIERNHVSHPGFVPAGRKLEVIDG